MRTASTELKAHMAGEVTSLARCWRIERTDGQVLGFTDHDRDLVVAAETYQALAAGAQSMLKSGDTLAVDSLEVSVILDSAGITEADLRAGLYENAIMWVFVVNYEDLTMGTMTLSYGRFGELVLHDSHVQAEFLSLSQLLQQNIGRSYKYLCDAQLGDSRCGASVTDSGTVTITVATSRLQFTGDSTGDSNYDGGRCEILTGANADLWMEIKSWGASMQLVLPLPFDFEVGDTFKAYYGCDKTLADCRDRFDNVVNFRGYPHIPGTDEMLKYPDAK